MTRRWFFGMAGGVGGWFGIKPAMAKPTPPAIKQSPRVTYSTLIGAPGYVFVSLYFDVEWNAEMKMTVGRPGSHPLTTSWITGPYPGNPSRRRWLGFTSISGLVAHPPLLLTLTSDRPFVVHQVVPSYRLPAADRISELREARHVLDGLTDKSPRQRALEIESASAREQIHEARVQRYNDAMKGFD
jgi:hypothetical protein